jgi:hypothetical protein
MRLLIVCIFLLVPIYGASAKNTTYNNPHYTNGLPIDYCLYPMKQCGHDAADKFCHVVKAGSVLSFKAARANSPTYIQGSGDTCDTKKYDHCDAFTQIICVYYTL